MEGSESATRLFFSRSLPWKRGTEWNDEEGRKENSCSESQRRVVEESGGYLNQLVKNSETVLMTFFYTNQMIKGSNYQ